MSEFDDRNERGVEEWTATLLPAECANSFDPKFILSHAVRSEVVDRLKSERPDLFGDDVPEDVFGPEQRAEFLAAMLSSDREAFDVAVERLGLRELPFAATLRQLISPVLDDLGQMWSDDKATFMDVTLATCRVQTFVCDKLSATAHRDRASERHGSIAFARPAGETHTLGLTVVTECFRIDGWNVMGGVDLEIGDDLWALVAGSDIDVLGLTVGSVNQIEPVAEAIRKVREVAKNRNIVIAVGGYCGISDPEAMDSLGADFIATDALQAIDKAAAFLNNAV